MKQDVYVGTYSCPIRFGTGELFHGKGKGIYLYEFNTDTLALELINIAEGVANPSYLTVDSAAQRLYAVNELKEFGGEASGAVSVFDIRDDGSLKLVGQMVTGGMDPCHVVLSPDRKRLIVSNYMSGSVSVYLLENGKLGIREHFIQYDGWSVNPIRQTGPHAHSAVFSRDSRFVFICDLGTDRIRAYRYNDNSYPLSDKDMQDFMMSAGSGLRCAEFGADGQYCYIANELDSSISVVKFDNNKGLIEEIQKVPSAPLDNQNNLGADLHIVPNGRFLYASSRGVDNLAIYHIDETNGLLSLVGFEPSGGRTPRSFSFDVTGGFLLCANQDSDNIVVFSIDNKTGRLIKESEVYAPTPVCVTTAEKRCGRIQTIFIKETGYNDKSSVCW